MIHLLNDDFPKGVYKNNQEQAARLTKDVYRLYVPRILRFYDRSYACECILAWGALRAFSAITLHCDMIVRRVRIIGGEQCSGQIETVN